MEKFAPALLQAYLQIRLGKSRILQSYLQTLVTTFAKLYKRGVTEPYYGKCTDPTRAYHLCFNAAIKGLIAFTDQAPLLLLEQEDQSFLSAATDLATIPFVSALYALKEPFLEKKREMQSINLIREDAEWDWDADGTIPYPTYADYDTDKQFKKAEAKYEASKAKALTETIPYAHVFINTPLYPYHHFFIPEGIVSVIR